MFLQILSNYFPCFSAVVLLVHLYVPVYSPATCSGLWLDNHKILNLFLRAIWKMLSIGWHSLRAAALRGIIPGQKQWVCLFLLAARNFSSQCPYASNVLGSVSQTGAPHPESLAHSFKGQGEVSGVLGSSINVEVLTSWDTSTGLPKLHTTEKKDCNPLPVLQLKTRSGSQ